MVSAILQKQFAICNLQAYEASLRWPGGGWNIQSARYSIFVSCSHILYDWGYIELKHPLNRRNIRIGDLT